MEHSDTPLRIAPLSSDLEEYVEAVRAAHPSELIKLAESTIPPAQDWPPGWATWSETISPPAMHVEEPIVLPLNGAWWNADRATKFNMWGHTHVPAGKSWPNPDRDWHEDYTASGDDHYYQNLCCVCDKLFFGYKRRVVCKVCSSVKPPVLSDEATQNWSKGCYVSTPPNYLQSNPCYHVVSMLEQLALNGIRISGREPDELIVTCRKCDKSFYLNTTLGASL